ncbi:MAG TPA: selenocysteine-specific translation elongation factor [Candidatus Dormibacteraeota bacterium]
MSFVVGTAGHIDHGKSTLIRALTGIDPDRLEEEKRRGMTIDLGFAYLTLPSGRLVGIVDVPGHARFIGNMLAGVHGLDALLLVVAADEGVMPQTLEHLEIAHLLEMRRGLVAITKADVADPDLLEVVRADTAAALAGTTLAEATQVAVSAVTGAGLEELRAELDRLLGETPQRADLGRPRLPIDRVFTIGGFGTVVTGTLVDGTIAAGDELEVMPSGRRVRVRGLQQHNRDVERAEPGSRAAVNLTGVGKDELRRGHVLAMPGALAATRRLDAGVSVLASSPRPLRHGERMTLHAGTAEVPARVIMLGGDSLEPGSSGWVQLYLERPLAAAPQDRFILRLPSPSLTLAGGRFADVTARRHARTDGTVPLSLARRLGGAVLQEELAKHPRGITAGGLLRAGPASAAELERIEARHAGRWLFAPEAWDGMRGRAEAALAAYHRDQPLRAGMPREELKSRLGLESAVFAAVVPELAAEGVLTERDGIVALPGHAVDLGAAAGPATRLLDLLAGTPFAPPSLAEAARNAGATGELVRALQREGKLVVLSPDVAFTRDAYDRALETVREITAAEGQVTVARLRDALGASRRPMLALLEHLDAEKITRRVGDARVLRAP